MGSAHSLNSFTDCLLYAIIVISWGDLTGTLEAGLVFMHFLFYFLFYQLLVMVGLGLPYT